MDTRQELLARFNKAVIEAATKQHKSRELRQKFRGNDKLRARIRKAAVEDLQRVYEHPDNPFQGFAASRDRYRKLGHFSETVIVDLFGTHEEFKRAANLQDSRETTRVKNKTARLSTERSIRQYGESEVLRSAGRWDAKSRARDGVKVLIVGSDFHGQVVDPLALRVWFDVIEMLQPDGVVLNGDVVDFPDISRYSQIPGAGSLSLQDEIDYVRDHIMRPTRDAAPDAFINYHIGNHEHRLVRFLADSAPQLADLRCLKWDTLFGVDEFGIEMVFGGNWLAPRKKDHEENIRQTYRVYFDSFVVTHGQSIAKNAMEKEIDRFGMSGTSGHTHRPGIWTKSTLHNPHIVWTSTGMMSGHAVGKGYVDGPSGWTMGFGVFVIDPAGGYVVPMPVTVFEDFASFNGRVWRSTAADKKTRLRMWGEGGHVTSHKRSK